MNEEEVKARIVLPWLQARGVLLRDIRLETSFSIHVGGAEVGIKSERNAPHRARLDILVSHCDRNLLVVEVKRESAELTDGDRKQAVSYARLVDPMAPLAAVTNGREWRLYDLHGSLLDVDSIRIDGYSISQPVSTRLEALQLFLECSPENLLRLCDAQVDREIAPLCGRIDDLGGVYIPEVQVERSNVADEVAQFLAEQQVMFVLTGESGMGKTCVMVDMARRLLAQRYPVFFFRGLRLQGSIEQELGDEIEWVFGGGDSAIGALRRLAGYGAGKPLIVALDGLEDWALPTRIQALANLVSHVQGNQVRLLVSCKTSRWREFLELRGARTGLAGHVFRPPTVERGYPTEEAGSSLELGPLSDRAFSAAVERYRQATGVTGPFGTTAWQEAKRSPFLLRLLFQVANATGSGKLDFDTTTFFETYLQLGVNRTSNPELALRFLEGVAAVLYDADAEWIEESALRRRLGLRLTETILPDLFEHRLLVATGVPGQRRIAFGFGQLRNYLAAFHVRRYAEMDQSSFLVEVAEALSGAVRPETIGFYYPFAPLEQQIVLDGRVREPALRYLNLYRTVIETDLPNLRSALSPNSSDRIGFAAELLLSGPALGAYGFRAIGPNDEEVRFVPVDEALHSDRLHLIGVERAQYCASVGNFQAPEFNYEVLVNEICPQLRELIERGCLCERESPVLAQELVLGIMRSEPGVFRALIEGRSPRFPVHLDEVVQEYQREVLRRHLADELVDERRRSGAIPEVWSHGTVSYSASLSKDDRADIDHRADEALRSGLPVMPRVTYVHLERLWNRLGRALEDLGTTNRVIAAPLLPLAPVEWTDPDAMQAHLAEQATRVLKAALDSYQGLVETNFPTLKSHLPIYSHMPVKAILSITPEFLHGARSSWVYLCDGGGSGNEVVTCASMRPGPGHGELHTSAGSERWFMGQGVDARTFVRGPSTRRLEYENGCVVRRWVYEWLRREWDELEEALLARYGVEDPRRRLR